MTPTRWTTLAAAGLLCATSAHAAEDTQSGGPASVTITMDMTMADSLTLTVTGDVTGNTTLAVADTALDFGTVFYGALGPLGTAGIGYQNLLESNQYIISRLTVDVQASGLLTGADVTASEGAGAVYADAVNTTAIVTPVGSIATPWAVDGTTGVLALNTSPALGTVLNLLPQSFEAGFRANVAAQSGVTSVPFVITATPI